MRPGQRLAEHIESVRAKFGRYPRPEGLEALDGHEYFSVRPYPEFPPGVPRNRQEERAWNKKNLAHKQKIEGRHRDPLPR